MSNYNPYIPVLEKAIVVIDYLKKRPEGATLAQVVADLGIPKSTTFRILNTLNKHAFLEKDRSNDRFVLGSRFLQTGVVMLERVSVTRLAAPIMNRLAEQTNETCRLSVPSGMAEVVCVLKVEAPRELGVTVQLGASFPMVAGAAGRCILAHLPWSQIDTILDKGLYRYTDHTITSPDELKEVLREVRQKGYAVNMEEVRPGVGSIAAPVMDHHGSAIAALSIVFFVAPEKRHEYHNLTGLVVEAAGEISRALGHSDAK